MVNIKRFVFNPFQVNTYVLSDETGEGIIVDGGVSTAEEMGRLKNYISSNGITPLLLVNTHAHIDHIIGNFEICDTFGIPLAAHKDSRKFIENGKIYADTFGLTMNNIKEIDKYLSEETPVEFGNTKLTVLETPGHADGSICLYDPEGKYVITGDVLFYQSIGRTDLETGDYKLLQKSIWNKLFTLPDDTVVYPGHGPETRIGTEKVGNPFVSIPGDR